MRHIACTVAAAAALALAGPAQASGEASARPGYMIVIGNGVDPAGMREYARVAVPLLLRYGGKLLFATEEGGTEVIEGGPFPGSIRVFEFPSLQAARDYYESEEYQRAIPLRAGNGRIDVMLADGFVPDPKWTRGAD
jgi:uncharacterized protein (DUF1330 family)